MIASSLISIRVHKENTNPMGSVVTAFVRSFCIACIENWCLMKGLGCCNDTEYILKLPCECNIWKRLMDYKKQICQKLEKSGGIITASFCKSEGIPTVYLSRLVREGVLLRVAEGLYRLEGGVYDEYYFFQYQFKKVVFSYETALHLLGVTDKIPQSMDVTVNHSYKFNEFPIGVNLHYVKKGIHELGMVEARTMFDNPVSVYSYERTLCDFVAHKDKMDGEVYGTLIRSYPKYAKRDLHALYEIATSMGIDEEVKALMDVVYA